MSVQEIPTADEVGKSADVPARADGTPQLVDVGARLRQLLQEEDAQIQSEVERRLAELNIGGLLRDWREQHGIKQADLARAALLNQSQISKIESGKIDNIELRTLLKALIAMGAHLTISLDATPESAPSPDADPDPTTAPAEPPRQR